MAFHNWTGSLIDAPFDVIEDAIQTVLKGAPAPYISPTDAISQIFIDANPEYRFEYLNLCKLYVNEFGHSDQLNLNEYGFSTWESSHPVINALRLVYNKFHWYHMQPIVKRIARQIRIQELSSGRQFSEADRIELIHAKAYDEQDRDRREALRRWRNDTVAESTRRIREIDRAASAPSHQQQSGGGIIDQLADYNLRNPLTVGIVGATIYHKLKDAFGIK